MGKIISIDEINRAVMEGKDDLVFELCKVFDHESYFDPIFDPPESFLQSARPIGAGEAPSAKPWSARLETHGIPWKPSVTELSRLPPR
jgi:hypothetical protein